MALPVCTLVSLLGEAGLSSLSLRATDRLSDGL